MLFFHYFTFQKSEVRTVLFETGIVLGLLKKKTGKKNNV